MDTSFKDSFLSLRSLFDLIRERTAGYLPGAVAKQVQIVFKLEMRAKSDKVPKKSLKKTSTRKGGAKSILSCAHLDEEIGG